MSRRPTVAVCAGKDCRAHRGRFDSLVEQLDRVAVVVPTRCLGVCNGPVAVVTTDRGGVVVRSIRSPKRRRQLVRSVRAGELARKLRSRRVRGKKERRALVRASRAVDHH